jgi:hypothetical protein
METTLLLLGGRRSFSYESRRAVWRCVALCGAVWRCVALYRNGMIENLGDLLGLVSARVSSDLTRFKDFIETQHSATGGWRGKIPTPAEPVVPNL